MLEPLEGRSSRISNEILFWTNDKYFPWNNIQKKGISRKILGHSLVRNLDNVLQIYLNSHCFDSPRPPAQVPCCPATIQLITRSQKVTQLQFKPKEDLGYTVHNIIH